MRVAAGVLLIIMSFVNFGGGFTWSLTGAALSGAFDSVLEEAGNQQGTTEEEKQQLDDARAKLEEARAQVQQPELILYYGLAEFPLALMELIAGIMCLVRKGALFVTITGVFEIALSALSLYVIGMGLFAWAIGFVVGILAILAANSIRSEANAPANLNEMSGFGGPPRM